MRQAFLKVIQEDWDSETVLRRRCMLLNPARPMANSAKEEGSATAAGTASKKA